VSQLPRERPPVFDAPQLRSRGAGPRFAAGSGATDLPRCVETTRGNEMFSCILLHRRRSPRSRQASPKFLRIRWKMQLGHRLSCPLDFSRSGVFDRLHSRASDPGRFRPQFDTAAFPARATGAYLRTLAHYVVPCSFGTVSVDVDTPSTADLFSLLAAQNCSHHWCATRYITMRVSASPSKPRT
jgi:hypothetical protein